MVVLQHKSSQVQNHHKRQKEMETLLKFLDKAGVDSSALDETIGDYVLQLVREGGTEEEVYSVLEGCYPELEESADCRLGLADLISQLQVTKPPPTSSPSSADSSNQPTSSTDGTHGTNLAAAGGAEDEEDVGFLREMMPQISDRGLRYVLHWLSKGNRATAATYLADEFSTGRGAGSALRGLEEEAEAFERREYDSRRKAQLEERRAEEDKNRRDAELEVVKKKIVGRYADQTEGLAPVANVAPKLNSQKPNTRYRDGKVVTTTGAKVIVESLKPEWDGGSRGKVKTKGKRGKGFV